MQTLWSARRRWCRKAGSTPAPAFAGASCTRSWRQMVLETRAVAEVSDRIGERTTILAELVVDGASGANEMCVGGVPLVP
jgi:hypothetical protein